MFIQRYLDEHHISPFIREIQTGCQISSYKSTIDRLNALEHKGYLKRLPNKHRGIAVAIRWEEVEQPVPVHIEQGAAI